MCGCEAINEIYSRLLKGDPTAPSEFAESSMGWLLDRLRQEYRNVDDELIYDAVTETILALILKPATYDPKRGRLDSYLLMSARADLRNALAREKRRAAQTIVVDDVSEVARHGKLEVDDPADLLPKADGELFKVVQLLQDPVDRAILHLMIDGERRTAVYSRVLRITDLPAEEQRRIVKRYKDRIRKKVQRALRRREGGQAS